MKPYCFLTFVIAVMISIAGCSKSRETSGQNPPVVPVQESDQEMNAAIAKARDTFGHFRDHWQDPDAQYSLKFGLPTPEGELEHIWFNPIEVRESTVIADCANEPKDIPWLKIGDRKTLNWSNLSDWMIIQDGKLYGVYTIRVLVSRDPTAAPPYDFDDY